MTTEDFTLSWKEYSARNRLRCDIQATTLKKHVVKLANDSHRSFSVNFMFFDDSQSNLVQPMEFLSDSHDTELVHHSDGDYWSLECSKSPVSIKTIIDQYSKTWVLRMCELSESFGCTFSSWMFMDLKSQEYWSNCEVPPTA